MKDSFCRISALVARKANKAVIFRRGPGRHTQMLVWDFNNDQVTKGQWAKKFSVHICSVSDDGQYVAIIGSDHRDPWKIKLRNWLALSHPPYFTAVGLWNIAPFALKTNPDNKNNLKKLPLPSNALELAKRSLEFRSRTSFEAEGWEFEFPDPKSERLYFTGYRSKAALPIRRTKSIAGGQILIEISGRNWRWEEEIETAVIRTSPHLQSEKILTWSTENWIDVDNSGRLVYADHGCLYAWRDFPNGKPQLIADLNPNKFENISPPDWALEP